MMSQSAGRRHAVEVAMAMVGDEVGSFDMPGQDGEFRFHGRGHCSNTGIDGLTDVTSTSLRRRGA